MKGIFAAAAAAVVVVLMEGATPAIMWLIGRCCVGEMRVWGLDATVFVVGCCCGDDVNQSGLLLSTRSGVLSKAVMGTKLGLKEKKEGEQFLGASFALTVPGQEDGDWYSVSTGVELSDRWR